MKRTGAVELLVEGTYNVRGVGAPCLDSPRRHWLYRSASLDALTAAGELTLRRHGVGRVIDLREDAERPAAPSHSLPTHRRRLYRTPAGPPVDATIRQVYTHLVDSRAAELTDVVRRVATSPCPVLVHCSAGKDRTGLVVAVALTAAGLPREQVVADYSMSAARILPHRGAHAASALAGLDLTPDRYRDAMVLQLDSPAAELEHALDRVRDGFGGADRYLLRHGMSRGELGVLRARLGGGHHG